MGPIDYSIDVQSPFQAALSGYGAGAAIRNDQQQQAQQQAALLKQQQLQGLLAKASRPGATADDFQAVMIADPAHAEAYNKAWAAKNTQQQQSLASDLLQWGAAIKSGKPQFAVEQMRQRADAMEKGGGPTPESQGLRTQAQVIEAHPEFALGQFQALLAANPLGKDAATALQTFGSERRAEEQGPAALAKAEADAKKAGVDAKYAEQGALKDLEKKGWDIKKIQADIDIARDANRIAAMNAQANRETNAIRREELGLQVKKARTELDDKIRGKAAEAESGAASMDNFLNTADRFLSAAIDKDGKPTSTLRAAAGPIDSRLPTAQQDVADLEALAETMGSQAFLSQVPSMKGLGALTEAEGKKLESSLANLSLKQSPEQIAGNVKEAQRLILKARKTLEQRTGVKLPPPDTPAANPSGNEVDALLKKYGG